jgi:hypothetical protein
MQSASAMRSPNAAGPQPYSFYPVAGAFGRDVHIAYYVDLDPTAGTLDWRCGHLTYNGSTGEDPYIRSFAEQDIGVPVYAALDGTVTAVHDGEPDRNTDSNKTAVSNAVSIQHGDAQATTYEHLRKGLLVSAGDRVTAGTQIGWVGSSGNSSGPHIHWESDWNGKPYEPLAGPCRPGASNFLQQPQIPTSPYVVGAFFSPIDFTSVPPNDTALRTGTYAAGPRPMFLEATLANAGAGSTYRISLQRPDNLVQAASGFVSHDQEELLTMQWAIDTSLDQIGTWTLLLDIDGKRLATMPFTVVSPSTPAVNRAPYTPQATIAPVNTGEVAVCRADSGLFADPDYDVVRYGYQWTVNGATVRTVTSAAQTDALPRQYATAGAKLSCSVTVSDGRLQSPAASAFVTVSGQPRRRVVEH